MDGSGSRFDREASARGGSDRIPLRNLHPTSPSGTMKSTSTRNRGAASTTASSLLIGKKRSRNRLRDLQSGLGGGPGSDSGEESQSLLGGSTGKDARRALTGDGEQEGSFDNGWMEEQEETEMLLEEGRILVSLLHHRLVVGRTDVLYHQDGTPSKAKSRPASVKSVKPDSSKQARTIPFNATGGSYDRT